MVDPKSRQKQPSKDVIGEKWRLAHFFEHMMFGGSSEKWVAEAVQSTPLPITTRLGNTTKDRTFYYDLLPANQIDLALFLEANRMHLLALTSSGVEIQRANVKEERRVSVDNQPYGKTRELLYETAYDAFPYKHSVLGSMVDLSATTMDEFEAFYKRYYAPNNATLVIVGDFSNDDALVKVKKYFEGIPKQPTPPRPDFAEPTQVSERRETVQNELAQTPRIDIAYKIPPGNSPDWYPIAVLCRILGGGNSSRLSQRLVRDSSMASNAFAGRDKTRGPGLAIITVNPRPGQDLAAIEKATYEEIATLQNQPVADWELEKVGLAARRAEVTDNEGFRDRAANLAEAAVIFGDANLVNTEPQKLARVTKEDIMRVARKYFIESNRTVIITLPKAR